jgi:anti-sigma regulatory factor (Ser/Thr protein kinase)
VSGFHHEVLFYNDRDQLLAGTVPFLRAGLETGDVMVVAMPMSTLELVRGELDGDGDSIRFVDMEQLGRNPGRIISAWNDFVAAARDERRRIRGIGEPIWPTRTAPELEECLRHESLLNLAFAHSQPWALLCPYDAGALDPEILLEAEHSHPHVSGTREPRASSDDYSLRGRTNPFGGGLPAPIDVQQERRFVWADLAEIRGTVSAEALRSGMGERRAEDLVVAVNEVVTNSVLYGGGSGLLCIWRERDELCCDVSDRGELADPLVGRSRPDLDSRGGYGLWLANQLCDLVQIRSSSGNTIVRLRMSLA